MIVEPASEEIVYVRYDRGPPTVIDWDGKALERWRKMNASLTSVSDDVEFDPAGGMYTRGKAHFPGETFERRVVVASARGAGIAVCGGARRRYRAYDDMGSLRPGGDASCQRRYGKGDVAGNRRSPL